jgi:uncharacterized protein
MKVYFDSFTQEQSNPAKALSEWRECRDCGPIYDVRPTGVLPLSERDRCLARVGALRQVPVLHIQCIAEEYWLVCNPVGQGQIVVLDSEAYRLFMCFRVPNALSVVKERFANWTTDDMESLVALFYKLGLLYDMNIPTKVSSSVEDVQTLVAWLHVTNACNLRCNYCYLQKNHESMSIETSNRAIDAIFRSACKHNMQKVQLKYAGGEASLLIEQVIALHDYARQKAFDYNIGMEAFIMSNGVFLSQKSIESLKERNIGIMISLDGIGSYHDRQRPFINGKGSFKYVDRIIQKLLTHGLVPSLSVTVSQRNLEGLPQLVEYILERDLPFSLNYYRENVYSSHISDLLFTEQRMIETMRAVFHLIEQNLPRRSLLNSLLDKANMQEQRHHTCGVGHNYLVIDQHGGVAKCQADIQHTLTTINDDDPLQAIRDDQNGVMGLPVDEKEGCRNCEWRYWCTGGCPLLTYRATGRYDIKSPNCSIYKALFPDVLRLEALRLLTYQAPLSFEGIFVDQALSLS